MIVVRVYVAVPEGRLGEVEPVLRAEDHEIRQLEAHSFVIEARWQVMVVAIHQESSRYAARSRHWEVTRRLRKAGIPYRLLAVDPASHPVVEQSTWHVLRDKDAVSPIRRTIAQIPGVSESHPRTRWRKLARRLLAPVLLGTSTLVVGRGETEADRNRQALHHARGEDPATASTWVMEQLDNPAADTGPYTTRPSSRLMAVTLLGWALVGVGFLLLIGFGPGRYGWAIILDAALVIAAIILIYTQIRAHAAQTLNKRAVQLFGSGLGLGILAMGSYTQP